MRETHLYAGLFISPFVILFAISVFFLVHAWAPEAGREPARVWTASDLPLPANLDQLSGRARIDALRPALDQAKVHGEVGWIQHLVEAHRLIIPVTVPGRVTTVTLDVERRTAQIEERRTGPASALIELHKSPGPHLVGLRMNWIPMRVWSWLADATASLLMFLTLSGVYLWWLFRSERRVGSVLLLAGATTVASLVYALVP